MPFIFKPNTSTGFGSLRQSTVALTLALIDSHFFVSKVLLFHLSSLFSSARETGEKKAGAESEGATPTARGQLTPESAQTRDLEKVVHDLTALWTLQSKDAGIFFFACVGSMYEAYHRDVTNGF